MQSVWDFFRNKHRMSCLWHKNAVVLDARERRLSLGNLEVSKPVLSAPGRKYQRRPASTILKGSPLTTVSIRNLSETAQGRESKDGSVTRVHAAIQIGSTYCSAGFSVADKTSGTFSQHVVDNWTGTSGLQNLLNRWTLRQKIVTLIDLYWTTITKENPRFKFACRTICAAFLTLQRNFYQLLLLWCFRARVSLHLEPISSRNKIKKLTNNWIERKKTGAILSMSSEHAQ